MKKIYLFGPKPSRGSFDDIFNSTKYSSIKEAYKANDYAECSFMQDEKGVIHIEVFNPKNPGVKKLHTLAYQNCPVGLDIFDDQSVVNLALSMI